MVKVVKRSGSEVTVEVTVSLEGSLLEMEGAIQEATNALGCCVSEEALRRFDTDGGPIQVGEVKLTARGRDPKAYQTPYGVVRLERYVYQSSRGGRIYCPLEHDARIIRGATPLFARQISHKYAQLNVRAVQTDLEQNHGRKVARSYLQNVAEWVGSIAMAKEEDWAYAMPALEPPIETVVVSLDGAMIPMADSEGYREAMVGTLSFYDPEGERQHTLYLAAAPEYGKHAFYQRLEREIARAKQRYPDARYLGIADGAASNWAFLEQHTERQLIDFFHASEYVGKLAQARYPQRNATAKRTQWQHTHCNLLKHDPNALDLLVAEAERLSRRASLSQTLREGAYSAWTYLNNHRHQMSYPGFLAEGLPIGSGVTEAACKTLVKQRLCASGMRWKTTGAKIVLSLRALTQTAGRWAQFWEKIDQFGAECCG
ncbi:ISKra4 family transposase [Thiorhodococcus minor]|uniref:ISKra4 family transposase n=1 Tax=Thiorhodococcus minor TaxID=57489 RepID=A0A6M0K566_9GAMM|nr:ISKra4 family transposase [Thiorhodococcus minor]NEV64918.1 ISKra4 family transposase [Thiorhodococcus minor]